MNDLTDQQLLREYVMRETETAFAELVRRHIDLVYSAALRKVCNADCAKDVTQGVFLALAQSARQLTERPALAGWLHRTAQNLAAKVVRSDVRRRTRELEAATMNDLLSAESDAPWEDIAPHLDEALGELSELDRDALLLRYFQRKSAHEVAQSLDITEEAAQKRVTRAVERLREYFAKRGLTVGASGLAILISANAVQAAPTGLSVTISSVAALGGTAAQTSTAVAATKTITMTTLQKMVVTTTLAVVVGAGIHQWRQAIKEHEQNQTLREQQGVLAEQLQQAQHERQDATNRLAGLSQPNGSLTKNEAELLRLRGDVARLRADSRELALLKAAGSARTNDPTEIATRHWIARTLELTKRIEQMPDAHIPEFAFLTPNDWLDIAKDASLETDTDVRAAAQMLAANAKNQFARLMKDALNKYIETNKGELPTEMNQLKPYFTTPPDDNLLQRYELLQSGNVSNLPDTDRSFRLIAERRTAAVGSGRPIVQIGLAGFIRTGQ